MHVSMFLHAHVCVHTRMGVPLFDAVQYFNSSLLMTGTLRRFLEHFGEEVDLVIFVSSDGNDVSIIISSIFVLLIGATPV